jgi:starch-binding outer membrane protein, SusD/RagB family
MKNIINIKRIAFSTLLLFTIGCSVDFDPKEEYKVTEADYLKTEADYRTMTVSCYTPLQWMNQLMVLGDIASDNSVSGGENASDVPDLQQMDDYTVATTNGLVEDLYKVCYEGVNRVNYLVRYKEKNGANQTINFTGKEAMYSELYFLRAYYYFNLVRMYGDVVLFTDKKLTVADFGTLKRSPKAEVYAQIELDLNNAIANLPTTNSQAGRVTKYAAQALLGKVLIYQQKFDQAIPHLESVIAGPFSLVANFDSMFLKTGENGPESVFEVHYSNGTPYYNWSFPTRGQGSLAPQQNGVRGLSGKDAMPYAPGWSINLPTQELANAYAAGDQRKDATCFDVEAYKNANPALEINYTVAPYKNTGLYNKKYLPRKGETSGQIEFGWDNNQRIIRFADVLLMAAESYNRATTAKDDTKAKNYLNRVRQRAFGDNAHDVSATGEDLKLAIWNERRLELAMEGDRLFDLIRTGQAATKLTGFIVGKNEVFPIPQKEVDISKLPQTTNW